jgi:CRP/FNR family transcriptional regulator, cyclic AMP receptor protein
VKAREQRVAGTTAAHDLELFAGLDPQAAERAIAGLAAVYLDLGQRFDVSATSASCCVVRSGRLALAFEPTALRARDRTIGVLEEGDVLVRPTASWAAVGPGLRCRAIAPSVILLVEREQLDAWMRVPELAANLVRVLSGQVADRELAVAVALEPRVERRLLLKLRQLAERWGRVTPEGVRLDLRLTHQELADMVGAVRESVTLALGRLARQGELEVRNRTILIRRPGASGLDDGSPAHEESVLSDAR